MRERIRIVLIGVRPLLADGICTLFRAGRFVEVLGSVAEAHEFADCGSTFTSVDVLVFDGRRRGSEFGGLIRWWKHRFPHSRAVVIDLEGNEPIVDWISCGLDAFVDEHAQFRALLETVRAVERGEANCPLPLLNDVVTRICRAEAAGKGANAPAELTLRETEILHFLAEGLSNKEIAVSLGISVYTVKNHIHNLLDKMKVHYRRHAIRFAREKGLLRPRPEMMKLVRSIGVGVAQ